MAIGLELYRLMKTGVMTARMYSVMTASNLTTQERKWAWDAVGQTPEGGMVIKRLAPQLMARFEAPVAFNAPVVSVAPTEALFVASRQRLQPPPVPIESPVPVTTPSVVLDSRRSAIQEVVRRQQPIAQAPRSHTTVAPNIIMPTRGPNPPRAQPMRQPIPVPPPSQVIPARGKVRTIISRCQGSELISQISRPF